MCNILCEGGITLSPIPEFVVKNHFVQSTDDDNCGMHIRLGNNFKKWFWEKKEEPVEETKLWYFTVIRFMWDIVIIAKLGETNISELCAAMKKQEQEKTGGFLTVGSNIFFARDASNILRKVYVDCNSEGWDIDAKKIRHFFGLILGFTFFKSRVFSHKFPRA